MINKECYYDCKEYFEKVGIVISISKEPVVWQFSDHPSAFGYRLSEGKNILNDLSTEENDNYVSKFYKYLFLKAEGFSPVVFLKSLLK